MRQREVVLLAIVLAAGIGLRVHALSRAAVEHFDEGVYASNIYFGPPDYAYPQQRLYAPPLLPALIEAGVIAGLPPNLAALSPGFLAGCGTIVALWWFGRTWFGPGVGLSAALLAALSDFHIAYSATALTDVLLGLWMILAVDSMARSLHKCDFRWAIAAGLYTGLAWWTKYNGWLPLAIEAAALPLLWFVIRPPRTQLVAWLSQFAVTALIALAVWCPYYLSLQSQGGYAPIAANHAKYVVGLEGWIASAERQIAAQYVMDGPATWLSAGLAFAMVWILQPRCSTAGNVSRSYWAALAPWIFGVILIVLAFPATGILVLATANLYGLWVWLRGARHASHGDESLARRTLSMSLIAAWWVGLLVATPCYWPYPRLMTPWLIACWLGGAIALEAMAGQFRELAHQRRPQDKRNWPRPLVLVAMVGLLAVFTTRFALPPTRHPAGMGTNRLGIDQVARRIRTAVTSALDDAPADHSARAIYVYGEPAVLFHLSAAGEAVVVPVQDLPASPAAQRDGSPIPTLLAIGPHAHRDPQFQRQWAVAKVRWELIEGYDYQPSAVVWLDLNDPRQAPPASESALNRLEIYRWTP